MGNEKNDDNKIFKFQFLEIIIKLPSMKKKCNLTYFLKMTTLYLIQKIINDKYLTYINVIVV